MDTKKALKAHMSKGMKAAHPDKAVKKMKTGGYAAMNKNMLRTSNQKGSK